MEQKKYTFKYIYLADGLLENAMANLGFVDATFKHCVLSDEDKQKLFKLVFELRSFVGSLVTKESENFNAWKKENGYAKEG